MVTRPLMIAATHFVLGDRSRIFNSMDENESAIFLTIPRGSPSQPIECYSLSCLGYICTCLYCQRSHKIETS